MSSIADPLLGQHDSQSSLLRRLTAEQRAELDRAIIDHEPASYRGMYKEFALHEFGVSFTAFYRYARRIRLHAALQDAAEEDLPPGGDDPARIARVLARRLWEALSHPDASPTHISRCFSAWRQALRVVGNNTPSPSQGEGWGEGALSGLQAAGATSRAEDLHRKEANAERRNTRALADLAQSMAVIAGYKDADPPEPESP